jgi:hypothetical protein
MRNRDTFHVEKEDNRRKSSLRRQEIEHDLSYMAAYNTKLKVIEDYHL